MNLTESQADALKELMNIAFARTAAALSQLTGHRVLLDLPGVMICPLTDLAERLKEFAGGEIASVHQLFTGPVAGDAMLLLRCDDATTLTDLLTDQRIPSPRLDQSGREVLTEVGNILLNACMGMLGNVLQVRISFAVPRLHLDSLEDLLYSLIIGDEEMRYALVGYTRFRLQSSSVGGYVAIAVGATALERLVEEIGGWAERATLAPQGVPPERGSGKAGQHS